MQTAINAGESRPKTAQPLRTPAIIGAHFPESDLSYAAYLFTRPYSHQRFDLVAFTLIVC